MHLLIFNLKTDEDDELLGFTTDWINALAAHCDKVSVITVSHGRASVKKNVRIFSLGKEEGANRFQMVYRMYALLNEVSRRGPVKACFSHMIPTATCLAAPWLLWNNIPVIQWYAHISTISFVQRLAHRISRNVYTISKDTYNIDLQPDKVQYMGHGINTNKYPYALNHENKLRILTVTRLSPIKKVELLIEALTLLPKDMDWDCSIVGKSPSGHERYEKALKKMVADRGLDKQVHFIGKVLQADLPDIHRRHNVHVDCSFSLNKANLEAMCSGLIPCSPAHSELEDFKSSVFTNNNARSISDKLELIGRMPIKDRAALSHKAAEFVRNKYSLERMAKSITSEFTRNEIGQLV